MRNKLIVFNMAHAQRNQRRCTDICSSFSVIVSDKSSSASATIANQWRHYHHTQGRWYILSSYSSLISLLSFSFILVSLHSYLHHRCALSHFSFTSYLHSSFLRVAPSLRSMTSLSFFTPCVCFNL